MVLTLVFSIREVCHDDEICPHFDHLYTLKIYLSQSPYNDLNPTAFVRLALVVVNDSFQQSLSTECTVDISIIIIKFAKYLEILTSLPGSSTRSGGG
jgi:hypothetical protein